ncbi:uncharacterized protein LOC124281952 [Haliotis rubra]|uniref:uncharacterized protein LOC124281952 n=1 Tax=Haliotis rubra TaxID=36100 RepID=UPI001EE5C09B|nr:uncharacterized protein LOC124281952 [Haliotis rubra]
MGIMDVHAEVDTKTFGRKTVILIVFVVIITIWLSTHNELKDRVNKILKNQDVYHVIRARFDHLNFNVQQVSRTSPEYKDEFERLSLTNVSRFSTPWRIHDLVFHEGKSPVLVKGNMYFTENQSRDIFFKYLKDFNFYQPVMTIEDRISLMQTLEVFEHVCHSNGIRHFLFGDTLLGLYRHQGFVPWTGSAHVCVRESDWLKLHSSLTVLPQFNIDVFQNNRWTFYFREYQANHPDQFPYLDISFFNEDISHIWSVSPSAMPLFLYKKSEVFPLQRQPFEHLFLPVPRNLEFILKEFYGNMTDDCHSDNFLVDSYIRQNTHTYVNLPCQFLHAVYPFVFRNTSRDPLTEILMVGETVFKKRKDPHT